MNETIVAVDPGKSGGIAFKAPLSQTSAQSMPPTLRGVCTLFQDIDKAAKKNGEEVIMVIESQTYCAGIKVNASTMGKFGENVGIIKGAATVLGWRIEEVRPAEWMAALSLGTRKRHPTRTAWKNHLKQRAENLFPGIPVTLSTSDALLLLEYAMQAQ